MQGTLWDYNRNFAVLEFQTETDFKNFLAVGFMLDFTLFFTHVQIHSYVSSMCWKWTNYCDKKLRFRLSSWILALFQNNLVMFRSHATISLKWTHVKCMIQKCSYDLLSVQLFLHLHSQVASKIITSYYQMSIHRYK